MPPRTMKECRIDIREHHLEQSTHEQRHSVFPPKTLSMQREPGLGLPGSLDFT